MNNRAQGAFEYILLLAGVLLIAVIVILILKGGILNGATDQLRTTVNASYALTNATWNGSCVQNTSGACITGA